MRKKLHNFPFAFQHIYGCSDGGGKYGEWRGESGDFLSSLYASDIVLHDESEEDLKVLFFFFFFFWFNLHLQPNG